MPVDFSMLEPDGLWLHIKLNALLSRKYGFFKDMTPEQKLEFDKEFENLISQVLPYDDENSGGTCNGCGREMPKAIGKEPKV